MRIPWRWRATAFVLVGFLSACSRGGREPKQAAPPPARGGSESAAPVAGARVSFGAEPASYRGVVPCPDCPGIETTLNVWPDGIYYLRMVKEGGSGAEDEIGRWELSPADSLLRLHGGGESPRFFRLSGARAIRQLDRAGRPADANRRDELRRLDRLAPFEPRLRLRGMYQSQESGSFFRDCVTQRPLRLLPEGEAAALQNAYLKADGGLDREMAAVIEVRLVTRPLAEGAGQEAAIVVERIFEVHPGEDCGPREAAPELEGGFWRVTHIGNREVGNLASSRRVPGIRLSAADQRLVGFSTCNRIMGGYTLTGGSLRFATVAATEAPCPDGSEFESAFLKALKATASWRITDGTLEFRDLRGASLARFMAVAGE